MSQSELNNKFRDKLGGYSSGIDPDLLWSAIADDVPQKKKRRVVFWIWGFASLLGFGLLTVLLLAKSKLSDSIELSMDHGLHSQKGQNSKKGEILSTIDSENNSIFNKIQEQTKDRKDVKNRTEPVEMQVSSEYETKNITQHNTRIDKRIDKKSLRSDIPVFDLENILTVPKKEDKDIIAALSEAKDYNSSYLIEERKRVIKEYALLPLLWTDLQIPNRGKPKLMGKYKRRKRIKPVRKPSHIFQANYSIGSFNLDQNLSTDGGSVVDDGETYFSQSIDIKYGHFLTSNIYATVGLNYDVKYKHFQTTIKRDTIVPSSVGEQLLATNLYSDGRIDNVSGVPEVIASFNRSVSNLNTFKSLNVGLGLGYLVKMKDVRLHVEGQFSRSIYKDISGLVILNNNQQRISDLSSLANQYSESANYNAQIEIGASFPIFKRVSVVAAAQYQKGLSNQISSLRGAEFHNSLKSMVGVRIIL